VNRPVETDVLIIGAGSGGKPLAGELGRAGIPTLVVEQALVGGECPYVACIPSKSMLVQGRHHVLAGPHTDAQHRAAWTQAVDVRDRTVRHRDDTHAAQVLTSDGAGLLRGRAQVQPDRSVRVGDTTIRWRRALVIATGSAVAIPSLDGLDTVPYWTSEDALSTDERPDRLLIMGGGPIGCELAQVYASFGSRVTLVQSGPQLLSREPAWLAAALAVSLGELGIDVRTSATAASVRASADGVALEVPGVGTLHADRLLVATGKTPRTAGLGLEHLDLATEGPLAVDERLRVRTTSGHVLPDVFAIGDVTAIAAYTHTANYHARTVAAHLLGSGLDADHTGIPRVVYTDPAVLCVGLTADQAAEGGIDAVTARFDARETSRSAVERTAQRTWGSPEAQRPGAVELVADRATGILIGASAIGPEADSWAAELALAVRARMRVHDLAQQLHAFPSWTEAIHPPARELAEKIGP
jgi:pyruvate/2-oxoglutarate dehydrogenase complex dihydrolipoamide dehydrogenase (E3) component